MNSRFSIGIRSFPEPGLFGKFVLIVLMIFTSTGFALVRSDVSEAALVSDATIRSFCNSVPIGYYDLMYIGNGSSSQTITLTSPSQTEANVTFKIETWFCAARTYALDTKDYTIKEQGSSVDRITWKSLSQFTVLPGNVAYTNPDGNKLMSSPTVNARIDVTGYADGSVHRLCPGHTVKSYAPGAWDEPVAPRCVDITIRHNFPWSLSATSTVSQPTANLGDTVTWNHTIRNDGPGATSSNIGTNYGHSGGFTGWSAGALDYSVVGSGVASGGTVRAKTYTYTIQPGDVGKNLCMWAQYDPTNSSGGRNGRSTEACVRVLYNFALTPEVDGIPSTAESNMTIEDILSSVTNDGGSVSKDVDWELTSVVVPSGGTIPNQAGGDSAQGPCGTYFSPSAPGTCSTIASGTDVFPSGGVGFPLKTDLPNVDHDLGNLAAGTTVCFGLSVRPYSHTNDTDWRHSPLKCLTIVKSPKVQVWGNDLRVGSGISTGAGKASSTVDGIIFQGPDGKSYGSWGEYGVMAPGLVSGFASGSGFAPGALSDWNELTFANVPSYGQFATPAQLGLLPNIHANIGKFEFDTTITSASISGWPAGENSVLVNRFNDSVTIDGDIIRPSGYSDVVDLPQMIIIADEIIINDNVNRVDAWLVAQGPSGTLRTCQTVAPLTAATCNQPLTINGPVIANKLFLSRTYGADNAANIGDAAETINLPTDTYMWVRNQSELAGSIQTVYSRELPPRY